MKKFLFIFAFLTLLFISSCNETSIKIINMENKNGEYYLKIDKDVDFISLSDYVSTTDDYEIETKQPEIYIDTTNEYQEYIEVQTEIGTEEILNELLPNSSISMPRFFIDWTFFIKKSNSWLLTFKT